MTAPPPPRAWLVGALALAAVAVALGLAFGACSQDDAFITFRYAANLVDGHGLVYNPGERVEGYTNLSWTLVMAAVLALGIDPVAGSTALGLACLFAAIPASAALARRAHGPAPWVAVGAAALVAVDPWTALEAVEGLETALYLLLLTLGAERAVAEADAGRRPWASSAWFCVAVLTRPEAPLVAALVHLGLLLGARDRRAALARALQAGALVALTLGALTAWRLAYYGEPLPNTFYAKTGGLAVPRGLSYLWMHARGHPALWLLLLARPLLRPLDRRDLPLALPALGILAYVVAVGGDFKPTGRFLIPVQAMLAAVAARGLAPRRAAWRAPAAALGGAALLAGAALAFQGAQGWAEIRHANLEARRTVGLWLRAHLPEDTLLAIHSAGAVPFYAGLPTIDMWGLADHHIARAAPSAFGTGLAGHERADPDYVFGRDPEMYLPEDRMFTRKPWEQPVEPGYPAALAERYNPVSVPIAGRFLNVWVRKGFLAGLQQPGSAEPGSEQ